MLRTQPVNVALALVVFGAGRARLGVRLQFGMHGDHIAVGILVAADALDDEAVTQPYEVAGKEAEKALGRNFIEIFALNPQFARERYRTLAPIGLLRMVGRFAQLFLIGGIVVDDQLQWVEHGDAARGGFIESFALAFLEYAHVDPRIGL